VSPNKQKTDRAIRALQQKPTAPAIKRNLTSVKRNLSFAAFIAYLACQGYEYPASQVEKEDAIQAGYKCTQLGNVPKVIIPDIFDATSYTDAVWMLSVSNDAGWGRGH
jgi:hypothetical protein